MHRAQAASQPTGLMADWERRRVSAFSYHNTVWHTWTTVTSINTQWLPHCLAERQIMRPVFALDFWFNVLFFFIDFRTQSENVTKELQCRRRWLPMDMTAKNICKTHMLRLKWFVYYKGWILGKNRSWDWGCVINSFTKSNAFATAAQAQKPFACLPVDM